MANRFQSLDGWRGLSIIFVLLGHLFPLGPKLWKMNGAVAASGMVIFFILSGFLIANIFLRDQNIFNFLIRRFFRIIPLAWLVMVVTFTFIYCNRNIYLPHFLFYANWPPMDLLPSTGHLWSLCVEMQFYVAMALLLMIFRSKVFLILPLICIAVTIYRYIGGVEMAINTYYRVDEILAGCVLAIINNRFPMLKQYIGRLSFIYLLPLLILSAHPSGDVLNYMRPYIAMLMIGSTLFNKKSGEQWLENRILIYIASVSFAVYVFHGGLGHTWLGSGDVTEKYAKRVIFLVVTFILAHLSTFYYERYWINFGRKLCALRIGMAKVKGSDI